MTPAEYLGQYFDAMSDDWLVNYCAIKDGKIKGEYRTVAEIKQDSHVSRFAEQWQADERNIYFTCNPVRKKGSAHASENDLAEVWFVPLDCDPPSDLSREEREKWKADKIAELEATDAMSVVDSGNGVQAIFRLAEPVTIDRAKEIAEALIVKHGGDNAAKSPANLMRLPGTTNYPNATKKAKGFVEVPAKVIRLDPARRLLVAPPTNGVAVESKREPSEDVTVADLSENRAAKLIATGSSMIVRRNDFENVIEPSITALFWQEQGERDETQKEGEDELKWILKNLRKKAGGVDDDFSDLLQWVSPIRVSGSLVRFTMKYDGSPFVVDYFEGVSNHLKIRKAVAEQTGKLVRLTRASWELKLSELWEDMPDDPSILIESEEQAVLHALDMLIRFSFSHTSSGVPYFSNRLLVAGPHAWLDVKKGRIYFKGTPMLSALNATGLGFKKTSHQFAEIIREVGGEAGKQTRVTFHEGGSHAGGENFSRSMRLHWIPCPPDDLEYFRGQASDKSIGNFDGNVATGAGAGDEFTGRQRILVDHDPDAATAYKVMNDAIKIESPF